MLLLILGGAALQCVRENQISGDMVEQYPCKFQSRRDVLP